MLRRRTLMAAMLGALGGGRPALARFEDELYAFRREDDGGASPPGAVLFVGSSTIRLWPDLEAAFAPRPVVQRGFGGATLDEVVRHRARLFGPHRPGAVVLYAGENDVAEGASAAAVVERFVALRQGLGSSPSGRAPFVVIQMKPTPARFRLWPVMRTANQAMAALSGRYAPAAVVETAPFVLRRGQPDVALFRDDDVHFNEEGYRRLTAAVRGALEGLSLERP